MENPDIIAIYTACFLSAFVIGYLFTPSNFDNFLKRMEMNRKNKSGLLLIISPFLTQLGEILNIKFFKKYFNKLERMLTTADLNETLTPQEFLALQIITPIPALPVILLGIIKIETFAALKDPLRCFFFLLFVFMVIFLIVYLVLNDKVNKRQKSINRELPFALDMLTSAVEAGLDFAGAIRRLVQKASKMTPLKTEFSLMLKEINLGKTRAEALKRMAYRVNLSELTTIVNSLIQADQLGTGVGQALTTLSDDLRVKRFQLAEKKALEAPVKMLFPLIAFIFPSVFIILIGPLMLQIFSQVGK